MHITLVSASLARLPVQKLCIPEVRRGARDVICVTIVRKVACDRWVARLSLAYAGQEAILHRIYLAITFVAVTGLVFASLVALHRMLAAAG